MAMAHHPFAAGFGAGFLASSSALARVMLMFMVNSLTRCVALLHRLDLDQSGVLQLGEDSRLRISVDTRACDWVKPVIVTSVPVCLMPFR